MDTYINQLAGYLLTQSWQIALLALIIGLISLALRNKSAHIRYLLWLIVLAKCLIPPLYSVSVAILPEQPYTEPLTSPALLETPVYNVADTMSNEPMRNEETVEPRQVKPAALNTTEVIVLLWLAGVILFLIWICSRAVWYTLWLRSRRTQLPTVTYQSFQELFALFKLKRPPRIWLTKDIAQPFVWGLLRGSVYLPVDFVNSDSRENNNTILAHELSHIARFDAGINILQVAAQAIYWFHPFVWWVNRKIRQEREKCCDERAVAQLNVLPEQYTGAIVETLAAERRSAHRIPSLAIVGSVKDIEERIKTIMKPQKRFYKRPSLKVAVVVLIFASLTIPTTLVLTARGGTQPPAQSVTSEKPEQPRFAARTFNSEVSFDVWVQDTFGYAERQIGLMPSATPLKIPACWLWGVRIMKPVNDWDLLIREISQNEVPGLTLRDDAVDSDLKQLTGLVKLRYLNLHKSKVTDAGLEYLKGMSQLEYLDLFSTPITDTGLEYIKGMTGLQELNLSGTPITDAGLEHIKGLNSLQKLLLWNSLITDDGLEHLKGMTGLKLLSLALPKITNDGLKHLKGLSGLESLYLGGRTTQITESGLEHLKDMTGLKILVLWSTPITDVGLEHLKDMTNLQTLSFKKNGSSISDKGLEHLKGLTSLQELPLGDMNITDAGLEHLKGLTSLYWLNLNRTSITDAGLEHLKGLTGLRYLSLSETPITDAGLEYLKGMTGLQTLYLNSTSITDTGLEHLKGLTGLQLLIMNFTNITDSSLEHLKGMTSLSSLGLAGTKITDKGLEHLKGLPGLHFLYLSNTSITDAALEHLKGLTGLRRLNLNNTKVTDAGIKQLKQSLPNLTINR